MHMWEKVCPVNLRVLDGCEISATHLPTSVFRSSFTCTHAGLINVPQPYSHHWCTLQTNYILMIPSGRKISDLPVTYQIFEPMRYQIMLLLPEISYESYLENFTRRQTYAWPEDPAWIIYWTCLTAPAVKSSAKTHLHVFSYIYPFLSPFTFFACYRSLLLFLFCLIQTHDLCIPPALNL